MFRRYPHILHGGSIFFVLAVALSPLAQEARWKELDSRVQELYKSGKYPDALTSSQQALTVAEATFGSETAEEATASYRLGQVFLKLGNYADAEVWLQRSLTIREKVLGPAHPDVAESLNSLGIEFCAQGKYADAKRVLDRSLAIREKVFGSEHAEVAQSLNSLGDLALNKGKYAEAEPLHKRALAIREKILGSESLEVAESSNSLGAGYVAQGKYSEAEQLYKRSLEIRERALGPEHPDVAQSLSHLAYLRYEQGQYTEAEPLYKRSIAIREKFLGLENRDLARGLLSLANLYDDEGRYSEAEPLYKRSLAIAEKVMGPEDPQLAASIFDFAIFREDQGMYSEAEPLYLRALAVWEKARGREHPDVANGLNSLAILYVATGRYAEAELLYKRSLEIREKVLGPENRYVATSLNNLGELYLTQGQYAEAEQLFKHSLAIWEKVVGLDHPNVGATLTNIAIVYERQGRYAEAEPLYERALEIREKALGPEQPDVAESLHNLAESYYRQGRYSEAESLYKRSLAIEEKTLGSEHPTLAALLNNLAELYQAQGRYIEAEALYNRSLAIWEKVLGPEHPTVRESLSNLATLFYVRGSPEQAEEYFSRSLENLSRQFQYSFTYMTERDRLSFLDMVSEAYPLYFSFCLVNKDRNPLLVGKMYDTVMREKGLVANSIAALRSQIASGGDKEALQLFEQLSAMRAQLATLLTVEPKNREEWRMTIDGLKEESNNLERALVRRSSTLSKRNRLEAASWEDVKERLKEGEAALEFIRFRFHDGKHWTDKSYYAALVVTPQTRTAPVMILLGEAEKLEGTPLADYRSLSQTRLKSRLGGKEFYHAFWKPIEPVLADVRRIYYSPDGVLNQVALGIIPNDDGRLLTETYDLRLVSSTRDLLRERTASESNRAVLVGNPRFGLSESDQRAIATRLQRGDESQAVMARAGNGLRSREQRTKGLSPLPGTLVEVQRVRSLLAKHHWVVDVYTGSDALAEVVKRLDGPRVLHLATHGFFLSDQEGEKHGSLSGLRVATEDPMLRSGLYFAGANRTLSGLSSSPEVDDGIVTAYEASGLNLQGTELVVLSACDTGLGQVKNGEGVFGLRRALQEAGAESVLMSLWSVPDRETQELMELFYKHWLSGQEKPVALRLAQMELRKIVKVRYGLDRPFYWGGFVLVEQ
jgi:tetratricopeptide (TPR) repeat protein